MLIAAKAYTEKAIVLHITKYGERQLIVHTLSESHSRQSYIVSVGGGARGVKRGMLQPLYLIEFASAVGRGQLHSMRDVRLSHPLPSIPASPAKSMVALFMAELLYRVVSDCEPAMYDLVSGLIVELDSLQSSNAVANFHLYFMVRLSVALGYAPTSNYRVGDYFDMKEGCFAAERPSHLLFFEPVGARILSELLVVETEQLEHIKLSGESRRAFLSQMVDYYGFHSQTIYNVRSIEILSEVF